MTNTKSGHRVYDENRTIDFRCKIPELTRLKIKLVMHKMSLEQGRSVDKDEAARAIFETYFFEHAV
jgi:hypothetical protein